MKADDLTRFTRWIIPGWVYFLAVIIFILADTLSLTVSQGYNDSILTIAERHLALLPDSFPSLFSVIFFALAGVPLGFLIYQAYYFIRWNSPFAKYAISSCLPLDEDSIFKKEACEKFKKADNVGRIIIRCTEMIFLESCKRIDMNSNGPSVYARYRYLYEVVHTLGASMIAVIFSFFSYAIIVLKLQKPQHSFVYGAISFAIMIIFSAILHGQYDNCDVTRHAYCIPLWGRICFSYFSSQLVISLWIVNIFINPTISAVNTQVDITIKFFLVASFLIVWIVPQRNKKSPQKTLDENDKGNAIWYVATISVAILARRILDENVSVYGDIIYWPFITTYITFLTIILVLFINRRNASRDMEMLISYTLATMQKATQRTETQNQPNPNTLSVK